MIPNYQQFMRPFLEIANAADDNEVKLRDVTLPWHSSSSSPFRAFRLPNFVLLPTSACSRSATVARSPSPSSSSSPASSFSSSEILSHIASSCLAQYVLPASLATFAMAAATHLSAGLIVGAGGSTSSPYFSRCMRRRSLGVRIYYSSCAVQRAAQQTTSNNSRKINPRHSTLAEGSTVP